MSITLQPSSYNIISGVLYDAVMFRVLTDLWLLLMSYVLLIHLGYCTSLCCTTVFPTSQYILITVTVTTLLNVS